MYKMLSPDEKRGYNTAQMPAAGATAIAVTAGADAISNYSFRMGLDPVNHPFKYFEKVKHIQMDRWIKGVKGSDKNIFRIPIPWWR